VTARERYPLAMCARQSWFQPAGESPASENTQTVRRTSARASLYRVLRVAVSRGTPRSVDRECAGRNASSVKVSSPDKHTVPWWPSQYAEAKAAPTVYRHVGTTGVQVHGMYTRLKSEPGRSARSGASSFMSPGCSSSDGQGLITKSWASARAEVRSRRSSEEVG
jgi:hypothetical protein